MTTPENDLLKELEKQLADAGGKTDEAAVDNPQDDKKDKGDQKGSDTNIDVLKQMKQLADAVQKRITELEKGALKQTTFDEKPEKETEEERLFKMLEAMTPEQRAQWASETGAVGVMKLMEFRERQLAKKLEELEKKASVVPTEVLAQEWRVKRKDWLEDEEVAAFAEGVDRMLLRKKGVSSYRELSPEELSEHLAELDKKVEEFVKKAGKKKEDGKDKSDDGGQPAGFRSLGAAAGSVTGTDELGLDITKLSGFDLESLSLDQLKKIEEKLMKGGV